MPYFYVNPERENDPYALPNVGGCLRDSEPFGPFSTQDGALAAAREAYSEE